MTIQIPACVVVWVRNASKDVKRNELYPIADDVWVTDRDIPEHCDPTKEGLITRGVVLVNDRLASLVYRGATLPMPEGQCYQINARLPHSADGGGRGLFSSLIWDVPEDMTDQQFEQEATLRIAELGRGGPR